MGTQITWGVRLERAKKRGGFTTYEKTLAGKWRTCAIGEKFTQLTNGKKLPKYLDSGDRKLNRNADDLGMTFICDVEDNNIMEAFKTYKKIQKLKKPSQIFTII